MKLRFLAKDSLGVGMATWFIVGTCHRNELLKMFFKELCFFLDLLNSRDVETMSFICCFP